MGKKKKKKPDKDVFAGFARDKKTLKAPFNAVFEKSTVPFSVSNWRDVQMPEYLWVALILNAFDVPDAIERLRRIVAKWPSTSNLQNTAVQPGSLSAIAALARKSRLSLLDSIYNEVGTSAVLTPLCHLPDLPARDDWLSRFQEVETLDHWFALGDAIQKCHEFHSENATHICWFMSLVGAETGQMGAAEGIAQELAEMRAAYPTNMEQCGGFFSCEAGNMRFIPTDWPAVFWKSVYRKLSHATAPPEHHYLTDNELGTAYHLTSLIGTLAGRFWETRKGSDDRIHETAFGIVFAAAALAYEVVELRAQNRFCGLAALRSVTECAINLSYLATKNDADLWKRFRQYGSGHAHLISTKLDGLLATAHCVDGMWINAFLQEEQSKHFTDIMLGDWTGENIRTRAQQGGTKDLYDSYYDYSSSLLHGDWLGVATFGYTWDLNPFHRLQHVPRLYPRNIPSVIPDLFRVLNRSLEMLTLLYPGLEYRLPQSNSNCDDEQPTTDAESSE